MTNCTVNDYVNDYGYGYGYGYGDCHSSWYVWGRWVVLGVVLLAALVIFFLVSCLTARRRRKAGTQPYYGTGWTLGVTPFGHGAATYNPDVPQPQTERPPPAYGGDRDNDVELGEPKPAHTTGQ